MENQPQLYSATPEEIRQELGLDEDVPHREVVEARWKQYEASTTPEEGDQNA